MSEVLVVHAGDRNGLLAAALLRRKLGRGRAELQKPDTLLRFLRRLATLPTVPEVYVVGLTTRDRDSGALAEVLARFDAREMPVCWVSHRTLSEAAATAVATHCRPESVLDPTRTESVSLVRDRFKVKSRHGDKLVWAAQRPDDAEADEAVGPWLYVTDLAEANVGRNPGYLQSLIVRLSEEFPKELNPIDRALYAERAMAVRRSCERAQSFVWRTEAAGERAVVLADLRGERSADWVLVASAVLTPSGVEGEVPAGAALLLIADGSIKLATRSDLVAADLVRGGGDDRFPEFLAVPESTAVTTRPGVAGFTRHEDRREVEVVIARVAHNLQYGPPTEDAPRVLAAPQAAASQSSDAVQAEAVPPQAPVAPLAAELAPSPVAPSPVVSTASAAPAAAAASPAVPVAGAPVEELAVEPTPSDAPAAVAPVTAGVASDRRVVVAAVAAPRGRTPCEAPALAAEFSAARGGVDDLRLHADLAPTEFVELPAELTGRFSLYRVSHATEGDGLAMVVSGDDVPLGGGVLEEALQSVVETAHERDLGHLYLKTPDGRYGAAELLHGRGVTLVDAVAPQAAPVPWDGGHYNPLALRDDWQDAKEFADAVRLVRVDPAMEISLEHAALRVSYRGVRVLELRRRGRSILGPDREGIEFASRRFRRLGSAELSLVARIKKAIDVALDARGAKRARVNEIASKILTETRASREGGYWMIARDVTFPEARHLRLHLLAVNKETHRLAALHIAVPGTMSFPRWPLRALRLTHWLEGPRLRTVAADAQRVLEQKAHIGLPGYEAVRVDLASPIETVLLVPRGEREASDAFEERFLGVVSRLDPPGGLRVADLEDWTAQPAIVRSASATPARPARTGETAVA